MVREQTTDPVLSTKLHRPPVDRNFVHRPHLIARLDQYRDRSATLVSAPAGYGKSILISSWLEACEDPAAWISLDKSDNDLRTFMTYLVTAVETLFPNVCRKTQVLLNTPNLPPTESLSTSMLNELDRIEQPFILVLDDYYRIKETTVHNLITEILKHPPKSFHLVIVGRYDPPLPIATLRAQSRMAEIRTQDLCFNVTETQTLLNQLLGIQVDPSTAANVEEKTEGWVTGVRLAALSMRQVADIDARLLGSHVDAQYVMEYLFTEVFSKQSPEISQYLLAIAILDRFCGPLCEAVCAPGGEPFACEIGGWEFIAWLKKENLFLISLDSEKRWFRFHHLFQKLLFNQLKRHFSTAEINALHSRASTWFAENGLIEEALQHALAGGEIPAAMQLVALHGHDLMNDQQFPRIERWLGMFTRDQVEQNPELLILEAWLNHVQTGGLDLLTFKKLKTLFDKLPAKTSISATQIKGHFDALCGIQHFLSAEGERALKDLQSACKNIPAHHKRARVFAHVFQAGAHQMVGDLETGLSKYHDAIKKDTTLRSGYRATYLSNLCFVYWIDADLIALQKTAERSLKIAIDRGLPEAEFFSLYFLGIAHYHQNNLEIAEEKLTAIDKNYYFVHPVIYAHSSVALALVYQARGKIERAREVCETVMKYAIDGNKQDVLLIIRAIEAELALRQGNLAVASHWARRFKAEPYLPPYLFYLPPLALIKIRIAENTTNSRQQAADLLDQLDEFLASIHYNHFRIHVLALQAMLHDKQGEAPAALEKLTEAFALAKAGGFIRPFVDLGPQMADLLKQLIKQNISVDYVGQIFAAFRDDEQRAKPGIFDHSTAHSPPLGIQPLVEPLTDRELDVLKLLAQRLQNKEIADKLFISPKTVKKHLDNIYGKLNVSSRLQAVEKTQQLGILLPL